MIREEHQAWGSFTVGLRPDVPEQVLDTIDHFGHVVVTSRRIDVDAVWLPDWAFVVDENDEPPGGWPDTAFLVDETQEPVEGWADWAYLQPDPWGEVSIYAGVVHKPPTRPTLEVAGNGVAWWLGSDREGELFHGRFEGGAREAVAELTPRALLPGRAVDTAARADREFRHETVRAVLDAVCEDIGAQWRVNPDFSVDVGDPEVLFGTQPREAFLVDENDPPSEGGWDSLPETWAEMPPDWSLIEAGWPDWAFLVDENDAPHEWWAYLVGPSPRVLLTPEGDDVWSHTGPESIPAASVVADWDSTDYLTGVRMLGATAEDDSVEVAEEHRDTPYRDPHGAPLARVRVESDSSAEGDALDKAAARQLGESGVDLSVQVSVGDGWRMHRDDRAPHDPVGVRAGEWVWCYDPDAGVYDPDNPVAWAGRTIWPVALRVMTLEWPVDPEMGCYYRLGPGRAVDLSEWVSGQSGGVSMTVGVRPPDVRRLLELRRRLRDAQRARIYQGVSG